LRRGHEAGGYSDQPQPLDRTDSHQDICNHQVHALRPYLWNSALQCELSAFHALLAQTQVSLETSITRKWIRAASRRVLASMQPSERNRLIRRRRELALCSNVDGFVDLVSADWSSDSPIWPPVVQRRVIGPGELQFLEGKAKNAVEVPESFKMDSRRIKEFQSVSFHQSPGRLADGMMVVLK